MFWVVCISNVTSVGEVHLSSFKLFCMVWFLRCKTLEYMKSFQKQTQISQNTKQRPLLEISSALRSQLCGGGIASR